MVRRPARYYSCTRCNYRGINEQHECASEALIAIAKQATHNTNAITAAIEYIRAAGLSGAPEARSDAPEVLRSRGDTYGEPQAMRLSTDLRGMLDRHVLVSCSEPHESPSYRVAQRCVACGEVYVRGVGAHDAYLNALAAVGDAARKAYLFHACRPIEQALTKFSNDELATLDEQLDMEMERIAKRLMAVRELMKGLG